MRRNKNIDKVVDRGLQDYENSEYMEKLVSKQDRRGLSARKKWTIAISSCSLALIVCLVLVFTLSPVFKPAPMPPATNDEPGYCEDSGFVYSTTLDKINEYTNAFDFIDNGDRYNLFEGHDKKTDKLIGFKIIYMIDDYSQLDIVISIDDNYDYANLTKRPYYNSTMANGIYEFKYNETKEDLDGIFAYNNVGYMECEGQRIYLEYDGISEKEESPCLEIFLSLIK